MNKRFYLLVERKDIYYRVFGEVLLDEVKEIRPDASLDYISSMGDVFRADGIIICGEGGFRKDIILAIGIFKKKIILYHIPFESLLFNRFIKKASWIVTSNNTEGYDYYPSPVLLSDLATPRQIERIWGREKLVSKRGCIGIIGLVLTDEQRQKFADALNFLIEDLDLNIVFIPILKDEPIKDVLSNIRYSANTRYVQAERYSSRELLGILSKIDILITSDEKGVICSMAVDRPVVALATDDKLDYLLEGTAEEEIIIDIDRLKSDELYSKIKIAWVHRDSIIAQMKRRIIDLRTKASSGIKRLGKEL